MNFTWTSNLIIDTINLLESLHNKHIEQIENNNITL